MSWSPNSIYWTQIRVQYLCEVETDILSANEKFLRRL
jgi:hypothetical protein